MSDASQNSLEDSLQKHGVELPTNQVQQIAAYARLLWDWNAKLNLTRHTDYEKFVSRDLVDSMALARLLNQGEEVLDVGSGGGVPGIVLAIVRPDLTISLSESVGKKSQVLKAMIDELDLPVAVHAARAEEVVDQFRFDSLIARAVGPLDKMFRWFEPYWISIGRLLAVKGPRWTEEMAEMGDSRLLKKLSVQCVSRYRIPGTEAESVILEITRAEDKGTSGTKRT